MSKSYWNCCVRVKWDILQQVQQNLKQTKGYAGLFYQQLSNKVEQKRFFDFLTKNYQYENLNDLHMT